MIKFTWLIIQDVAYLIAIPISIAICAGLAVFAVLVVYIGFKLGMDLMEGLDYAIHRSKSSRCN